jgi:putative ABC transport system permease protein
MHTIGAWDLVIGSTLVLVAVATSLALQLGIARRLLIGAVRAVAQLVLIGLVLEKIFAVDRAWLVMVLLSVMLLFAGREVVGRTEHRYRAVWLDAMVTMAIVGIGIGAVVTQVVVGVDPWYDPRYTIPLVGMILGNTLNGVSLCLERILDHLATRRAEVELRLAFGATRREALQPPIATAVRTGMVPIVNSMAAVGVVFIPGMMTGQILAGADPLQAVAYQITVMFMIAASNALGAALIAHLAAYRLLSEEGHLLRL